MDLGNSRAGSSKGGKGGKGSDRNETHSTIINNLAQQMKKMQEQLDRMKETFRDVFYYIGQERLAGSSSSGGGYGGTGGKANGKGPRIRFKANKPGNFEGSRGDIGSRDWAFDMRNYLASENAEVRGMLELAKTKYGATAERYKGNRRKRGNQ